MATSFFPDSDDTTCWVYMLKTRRGNFDILYSLDAPEKEIGHAGSHIVFIRRFTGVANALAYKLLLENMHPETLREIIVSAPIELSTT